MSKPKESKQERRGRVFLEGNTKRREYKHPITVYLHYRSAGGELLAVAHECSKIPVVKGSNIVEHFWSHKLKTGVRLVELPSKKYVPIQMSESDV